MDELEIEKRFADHHRRFTDKLRECKREVDVEFTNIAGSMTAMQADVKEMKEILEAWNNMKGFASGMRFFATAIKIITPVVLLIGGIYFFFKTGKLPE